MTRAITLGPIFHFILCYLYIYLYQLGFGSDIYFLIKIEDIFTVRIGKIAPFYFISAFGFITSYFWLDSDPFKIKDKEDFQLHPSLNSRMMGILFISIPILCLINVMITLIFEKSISLNFLVLPLVFPISLVVRKIFEKNRLSSKFRLPSVFVIAAMLNFSANAYTDGFHARNKEYSYFQNNNAQCGEKYLILYSRGDKYIAVSKYNRRIVVNERCEILFTLPKLNVILDLI